MLSIGLAVLATTAGFIFGLIRFGWGSAVLLGLVAGLVVLISLVRRARKPIQAAMDAIEADVKRQRFDQAIERLQRARGLGRWQPFLTSQIDEQIGILHYAGLKDPDGARPYLERARHKSVQGWTMLAASSYRRGRYEEAERVLERAARRRPKEGLIWAAYAWCRLDRGRRAEALNVLARGRKCCPPMNGCTGCSLPSQTASRRACGRSVPTGTPWSWSACLPRRRRNISPDHPALRRRRPGARARTR